MVDIEPKPRDSSQKVERALMEAIDETITALLGASVKKAFYDYLERDCSLMKADIPIRLQDFSVALENVAGRARGVIERAIGKKLQEILGLGLDLGDDATLYEYVTAARAEIEGDP